MSISVPVFKIQINMSKCLGNKIPKHCTLLRYYATGQKVAGSNPDEVIGFFTLPNPSSRTMALESTQPPTEMSTRSLPGGKGDPAREAGNLTTICEPVV
jgi:hypothetical protein